MDSHDVRRRWANRSGAYSPEYYAYYGPNETSETIRAILERTVGRDAAVLELGCSSGRHLAHLLEHGFDDLTGIEVNVDAREVMDANYPDLAAHGTFHFDAIENVVTTLDDDRFDAVYSVQTLQHLHPDLEWVFDELARITADCLVTVEIEESMDEDRIQADPESDRDLEPESGPDVNYVDDEFPLYYRDWNRVFTEVGFTEVDVVSHEHGRGTVRTFRTFG